MTDSRLFKLVHLINRTLRQGFHRNRQERRAYRKWLWGRLRHIPDQNHAYHPLFQVIGRLTSGTAPGSLALKQTEIMEGKLAEHIRQQRELFSDMRGAPMTEEAKKLCKVMETRKYEGILVYPHVVYWEPLQTPQQFLRAFAKEGWLCFFCEHPNLKGVCREEEPNLFITYEADFLQAVGDRQVTVLLTWMGSLAFVEQINNKRVWYHILDHLEIFAYYDSYYLQLHRWTVQNAEAVVSYVAEPLRGWTEDREDAQYLPNAVNVEEIIPLHADQAPNDMRSIIDSGHKIIGYYGYLAEWMDQELVCELARQRPEWEFVFVGKAIVDVSALESLPNVHLLGFKPYQELFDYAQFFDVTTIPFRVDEKMDCVSPIKFYEYLALGKPVVSSSMKEV